MAESHPALSPQELAACLEAVLARAEDLVRSAPRERLAERWAGDLTGLDLSYRIFRMALAFADAMDFGRLPEQWLEERAPADLADGPAVARYAALVRGRVGGWFEGASRAEYARLITVPSGRQSGDELLQSITARVERDTEELRAWLEQRSRRQ